MKYKVYLFLTIFVWSGCNFDSNPNSVHEGTAAYYDHSKGPFFHGVASGDPLSDRVILWTRVTAAVEGEVEVSWEISDKRDFSEVVESGTLETSSERDYTVKVDATGLSPAHTYFYRFQYDGKNSEVGVTKTLPVENPKSVKVAVVSCSNFEAGYFNAFARIADRSDLDAVLHLGDYIYEYAVGTYGDTTLGRLNVPDSEIVSLSDYRTRYALYRLDPDLKRVHQSLPFITIWDDHEIANNAYQSGAQNHQKEEGDYMTRRSVARQVYYEWMPIREDERHYRSFKFGNLVHLVMLDERLEGRTPPVDSLTHRSYQDPSRSMLGSVQMEWFKARLLEESTWRLIGNQVIFSGLQFGASHWNPVNLDSWDGWPVEQNQIKNFLAEENIENTLFVTGDTHASWAIETPVSVENYDGNGKNNVAVEFGTTSITSANMGDGNPRDAVLEREQTFLNLNAHLKYVNMRDHGYLLLTIDTNQTKAEWIYVDTVKRPSDNEHVGKTYTVKSNSAVLEN